MLDGVFFKAHYLGQFCVTDRVGKRVSIANRKSLALLLFLIRVGQADRTQLSDMLWSNSQESQRRASLRQSMVELRRAFAPHDVLLSNGKHRIEVNRSILVSDLRDAFTHPHLLDQSTGSAALPDFLLGLDGLDPEFDEWLYQSRNEIRQEAISLVEASLKRDDEAYLTDHSLAQCMFLRRIDPYSDYAVTRLIRHEIKRGSIANAAKFFLEHKKLLEEDLQVTPQFDLTDFVAITKADEVTQNTCSGFVSRGEWFREDAVEKINKVLNEVDPLNGRVVMLVGPSGIGKTYTANKFLQNQMELGRQIIGLSNSDYSGGTEATLLARIESGLVGANYSSPPNYANELKPNSDTLNLEVGEVDGFEESITGSFLVDALILRSVEISPTVFFFDDVDAMSPFQFRTLKKVLSLCENSHCLVILACHRETAFENLNNLCSIRLEALNPRQVYDFVSFISDEQSSEYLDEIVAMSLGLPMLIQRAVDHTRIIGTAKQQGLRVKQSAGASLGTVDWSNVDQVLLALPERDRCLLSRLVLIGGKVSAKRYSRLFLEDAPEGSEVLFDFRLLDERAFRQNGMLIVAHDMIAKRCEVALSFGGLIDQRLPTIASELVRSELSSLCRYLLRTKAFKSQIDDIEIVFERLRDLEMWSEVAYLAGELNEECALPNWVKNLYFKALFKSRRYITFERDFSPNSNETSNELQDSYSRACAYIGATPKYEIHQHYTSDFFRGRFRDVVKSLDKNGSFEAHGYRAMALAQLGEFKNARKEVSLALNLATKGSSREQDHQLAEFFRQYVLTHQGNLEDAVYKIRRSLHSLRKIEGEFEHSLLQIHLGFVLVLLDRPDAGLKTLLSLYELLPTGEAGVVAGYCETALTSAYLSCGLKTQAAAMADRSLHTAKTFKLKSVEVWARRNMFRAQYDERGFANLEEAIELARELGMKPDLAHLQRLNGVYQIQRGQKDIGRRLILEAETGYAKLGMIGKFRQAVD